MSETTAELERLVREEAAGCDGGDPWGTCPACKANGKLARLAPALAAEVLAGRKALAQAREALGDIRGFAQEVQRGTDVLRQGDAHGCGANIEEAAGNALAELGVPDGE